MRGLSNYPPGHPTGSEHQEIQMVCRNEDCPEWGGTVTVTQVYERDTGAAYIEPEDDLFCEVCREELHDV
jgi:hypothetical protein